MIRLAWRNMVHYRLRLAISAGGIALAIMLALVMGGVFDGSEAHAVSYIINQPASIWLMQDGVENIHMSSTMLPASAIDAVEQTEGVAEAVGVLYATVGVEFEDTTVYSYLFGIDADIPFGGPWAMAEGSASPGPAEIVIDRTLAQRHGLRIGDTVDIMGYSLRISGLSEDAFGIATSVAFVNKTAMALLMGVSPRAASYILVQPETDVEPETVMDALRANVPEAHVMTGQELATSDQEMIRQMGADIIGMMNIIANVIGLLVIGMTIYTATLERAREYGVMKAIGANPRQLLSVVMVQALVAAAIGLLAGVVLAYGIGGLVNQLLPEMLVLIKPARILNQIPVLVGIAILASFLPIRHILRLDPVMVFRA